MAEELGHLLKAGAAHHHFGAADARIGDAAGHHVGQRDRFIVARDFEAGYLGGVLVCALDHPGVRRFGEIDLASAAHVAARVRVIVGGAEQLAAQVPAPPRGIEHPGDAAMQADPLGDGPGLMAGCEGIERSGDAAGLDRGGAGAPHGAGWAEANKPQRAFRERLNVALGEARQGYGLGCDFVVGCERSERRQGGGHTTHVRAPIRCAVQPNQPEIQPVMWSAVTSCGHSNRAFSFSAMSMTSNSPAPGGAKKSGSSGDMCASMYHGSGGRVLRMAVPLHGSLSARTWVWNV